MYIHSKIAIDSLRPFRLARSSLPIWLYMKAYGRRKTIFEKQFSKLCARLFRLLQLIEGIVGGTKYAQGTLAGSGQFSFNSLNTQFHSIYQYVFGYELDVMASIRTLLPTNGVFVDVGANWGYFAIAIASDAGFSGKVIAFEPSKNTYPDFMHILDQLNGLRGVIEPHNMALSDRTGTAYLEKNDVFSGLAKVSLSARGEPIELIRLDDMPLNRLDLIKIDVEGHELEVLQGAVDTLTKHYPVIIFENWCDQKTSQGDIRPIFFLEGIGYRFFMAGIAISETRMVVKDLNGTDSECFDLSLIEFDPEQRMLFERRSNILAIHGSQIQNGKYIAQS